MGDKERNVINENKNNAIDSIRIRIEREREREKNTHTQKSKISK